MASVSNWVKLSYTLGWSHTPYRVLLVRTTLMVFLAGITACSSTLQSGHKNKRRFEFIDANFLMLEVEKCVCLAMCSLVVDMMHMLSLYTFSLPYSLPLAMSLGLAGWLLCWAVWL